MAQVQATIGIKNSGFKNGLNEMKDLARTWSSDIKGQIAGAFAFTAIASFFTNFMQGMAEIKDLSDRLGESTDDIQRVGYAAKMSGSDLESIIKTMTKLRLEAASSADKFEKVGISATSFVNSGIKEGILMLSEAYKDANGEQAKMADLQDLLGMKSQNMLIMLSGGAEGIKEMFSEAAVASREAIEAMARLDDTLEKTKGRITAFVASAVEKLRDFKSQVGHWSPFAGVDWEEAGKYMQMDKTIEGQEADAKRKKPATDEDLADPQDLENKKKEIEDARKSVGEKSLALARVLMDTERQITNLKEEQVALEKAAQNPALGEAEKLRLVAKSLSAQKEIVTLQKAFDKDSADASKKKREDIDKVQTAVTEERDRIRLDGMSPKDRLTQLKGMREAFYKEADEKKKQEDAEGSAKARLKGLQLSDDIKRTQEEIDSKAKRRGESVVSSSLGAIGGGGGVFSPAGDPSLAESQRQTNLLQQLVRNTSRLGFEGQNVGKEHQVMWKSEPLNPF